MAQGDQPEMEPMPSRRFWPRRKRWRVLIVFLLIILGGILLGWMTRERIATSIIEDQLAQLDLPATYTLGTIDPEKQILENVVIGDPDRPDLTIDRVTVFLRYRFGTPAIGRVELVRPRLYGEYRDGKLSFGSLDPLLFAESDEPASLPDLDLALVDGRALIETDFGPIGIKAAGEGELDDSFKGIVAVNAPSFAPGDCILQNATLYAEVVTGGGIMALNGPLRLADVDCAGQGVKITQLDSLVDLEVSPDFAGVSGSAKLSGKQSSFAAYSAGAIDGDVRFGWNEGRLTSDFDIDVGQFSAPQASFAKLTSQGSLRTADDFNRVEFEADIRGTGMSRGRAVDEALAELAVSGEGTLFDPLLSKLRLGIAQELDEADLRASVSVRKTGEIWNGVIPGATLRGKNGATVLALSQAQFSNAGAGGPRISGNIETGGRGLPRIRGRMERAASGSPGLRLRMDEYSAGESRIAIPQLAIAQSRDGTMGFSGQLRASGPVPSGRIEDLLLPVRGRWNTSSGLALWNSCTNVSFDQVELSGLRLDRRSISVCPATGRSILNYDDSGLRVAGAIPSLDLSGRLADTPISLLTGAVGFAWPGAASANNVEVVLGPQGTASRFSISSLDATFGDVIGGSFSDADVFLDAVPLDIEGAAGSWDYAGDVLSIRDGRFRLLDRETEDRFEPLVSRGATLALADNVVTASTDLFNPGSERLVTKVAIQHDLSTGSGHADLDVPGILFDESLQPDELTILADGVIELAKGTVTGSGRIDWDERNITSSGAFSSDGIDFAAAFGPVKGASGTVEFSDLLNLTTAPGQKLKIASVNPGIEVMDGEIAFSVKDGQFLTVDGGTWPFMGGTLRLKPVDMNLGISEQRSYVFVIEGLDAGIFVAQMELGNINASGIFDGEVPIVFDQAGNGKIDGGKLVSRAPGGNLSYVGELTYEDMGTMANFAFQSLRSLDYQQMTVNMNGSLSGEIITEVRFEGVSQGAGTKSNFVTRQIANLPLEFRVNIRAAFAELLTNLRSLYDPAFVKDPRELGLITDDGVRLKRRVQPLPEVIKPEDIIPDEPPIQSQESENMR